MSVEIAVCYLQHLLYNYYNVHLGLNINWTTIHLVSYLGELECLCWIIYFEKLKTIVGFMYFWVGNKATVST